MILDSKPKLRWPLDVQTIEHESQLYLIVSDPRGISPEPATIPHPLLPILARLDGLHTLGDILNEGAPYGLTQDLLLQFVQQLDQLLLLDGPEAARRWEEVQQQFRKSRVREAAHAGLVYADKAAVLRKELKRYISKTRSSAPDRKSGERIAAMISPHIDYERGWRAYGAAYQALKLIPKPDVLVLIGTAHQAGQGLFHLTDKDFATPLGIVPCETELVKRLAERYGYSRAMSEEILHRREHSLELQLPFFAYRYQREGPPPIVPILVGSFHSFFGGSRLPAEHPEVGDFIAALAEVLGELRAAGKRVLFHAGVDFSHMGLYFGDQERISDKGLAEIEERDRAMLDCILAADEERLFSHMAEDHDRRRVCGYPSMYTMLASMRRAGYALSGHQLDYRQAVDKQTDCIVTFASAYWTDS